MIKHLVNTAKLLQSVSQLRTLHFEEDVKSSGLVSAEVCGVSTQRTVLFTASLAQTPTQKLHFNFVVVIVLNVQLKPVINLMSSSFWL
jgi:hypothetical protein